VLRAEAARLRLAVAVRTGSGRPTVALASGARALGSLFVRSTERADRLHLAAELRGASSAPAATGAVRVGWATGLLVLIPALVAVAARVAWA